MPADDLLAQRFPAKLPFRFHLVKPDGARLESQPRTGHALDASETGLRIHVESMPEELVARLRDPAANLKLEMSITVGTTETVLNGTCRWAKDLGKSPGGACVLGVEYLPADRERGAALAKTLERRYVRPRVLRAAGIVALMVTAVAAYVQWTTSTAQAERVRKAQDELSAAMLAKQELAKRLTALEETAAQAPTVDPTTEAELADLRAKLEEARKEVGERSVTLAEAVEPVRLDPVGHARRGAKFFADGNVAAAFQEYSTAVKLDPKLADAHLKIGLIDEFYGLKEEAVLAYQRYLELKPNATDLYEVRQRIDRLRRETGGRPEIAKPVGLPDAKAEIPLAPPPGKRPATDRDPDL